jgi:phosphoglycolate phosphatase-like HAD superfamily hydrolase
LARLDSVTSDEAIVVGDTPYDAQAAAKAGMKTIALLSGGFSEEALRQRGVIDVYCDIADLLEHYEDSALAGVSVASHA